MAFRAVLVLACALAACAQAYNVGFGVRDISPTQAQVRALRGRNRWKARTRDLRFWMRCGAI